MHMDYSTFALSFPLAKGASKVEATMTAAHGKYIHASVFVSLYWCVSSACAGAIDMRMYIYERLSPQLRFEAKLASGLLSR